MKYKIALNPSLVTRNVRIDLLNRFKPIISIQRISASIDPFKSITTQSLEVERSNTCVHLNPSLASTHTSTQHFDIYKSFKPMITQYWKLYIARAIDLNPSFACIATYISIHRSLKSITIQLLEVERSNTCIHLNPLLGSIRIVIYKPFKSMTAQCWRNGSSICARHRLKPIACHRWSMPRIATCISVCRSLSNSRNTVFLGYRN